MRPGISGMIELVLIDLSYSFFDGLVRPSQQVAFS